MGLLDNTTQRNYYKQYRSELGSYQFVSLADIINQFMIVYTGEEKIITKANKMDVAFHAQRALAELSFDTFKSVKSQEIELPSSLTMMLPHDYVNYTKISTVDDSGIKHGLYPTLKQTSNPFKILQNDNKDYDFSNITTSLLINNADFSEPLSAINNFDFRAARTTFNNAVSPATTIGFDKVETSNNELIFTNNHDTRVVNNVTTAFSHQYAVWQLLELDSQIVEVNISAKGLSTAASGTDKNVGILRVGLTTAITPGSQGNGTIYDPSIGYDPNKSNPKLPLNPTFNMQKAVYNLPSDNPDGSFVEFSSGNDTLTSGTVYNIDLRNVPINNVGKKEVYLLIVSDNGLVSTSASAATQKISNLEITTEAVAYDLIEDGESTTWNNYKTHVPSENQQHDYDYDDHVFEANVGRRYGIEPSHAQDNGSFYIDELRGNIHFSSTLSGKTIVLDYISDSLGTEEEMKVHKFAEEAMYKCILYAILSTRANTPDYIVRRYKKERFAEIRKAKLRLSNIKLEEITQIFRGKSKQIKH